MSDGMGMRIWDDDGRLTFAETDFTMRVLGTVQIRLGTRSGRISVPTSLARPGVYAIVNILPGSYTAWPAYSNSKRGVRGSLPTVAVGNGELILNASARTSYLANLDVILVGTQ